MFQFIIFSVFILFGCFWVNHIIINKITMECIFLLVKVGLFNILDFERSNEYIDFTMMCSF